MVTCCRRLCQSEDSDNQVNYSIKVADTADLLQYSEQRVTKTRQWKHVTPSGDI